MMTKLIFIFGLLLCSSSWKGQNEDVTGKNIQTMQDNIINSMNNNTVLEKNKDKAEQKIKELNSISDLESAGRLEQSKNQAFTSSIFIDATKPDAKRASSEAKSIAQSVATILNDFTGAIKRSNSSCIETQGTRELKSEYTLQIQNKSESHAADEPQFCESLRNQYDCYDTLEIHCLSLSNKPEDIKILSANFKYTVKNELMTMRHDYNPNSSSYSTTSAGIFQGGALFGSSKEKTHDLCIADLKVTFDVRLDPKIFSEFALLNLYFTDLVSVHLNNQVIYNNLGGYDLRFAGRYERVHTHTKKIAGGLKVVKYYENFPVANIGSREVRVGQDNSRSSSITSIDLRPHLRMHNNELVIKGISINQGYVQAQMRSYERLCLKWSEDKWSEVCTLK